MSPSKALSDEQNATARVVVRRLLKERFAGDQSACAAALSVSQPTLSNFLSGGRGTGPKMIAGVAKLDPAGAAAIFAGRDIPAPPSTDAAPAAPERAYTPARQEIRDARLSEVRKALLKKYSQAEVAEVISGSEFLDGLNVSELEAYQRLEELILLARAESKGKLIRSPAQPHSKTPPKVGSAPRSNKTSLNAEDEASDFPERTGNRRSAKSADK